MAFQGGFGGQRGGFGGGRPGMGMGQMGFGGGRPGMGMGQPSWFQGQQGGLHTHQRGQNSSHGGWQAGGNHFGGNRFGGGMQQGQHHFGGPGRGPMMPGQPQPQPRNVGNNDSVEWIEKLGNGAFGEVYKAKYNDQVVAAKTTGNPTGFPKNEIAIMRDMQSEHVAELIGEEHQTPKGDVILMKLYRGSLDDQIKKTKSGFKLDKFLKYMEQVCRGLHYVHMKDVIFNDLKPDNLLMDPDSDKLVFADFGDARRYDAAAKGPAGNPHELGWGAPQYHCRPDVMSQMLTPKSDMWMLAQMAQHMWTGQQPASNPCRLQNDIPLRNMLQKCLSDKANDRPSAATMLGAVRREIRKLSEREFGKEKTNTKREEKTKQSSNTRATKPSDLKGNKTKQDSSSRKHTSKPGSKQRTAAA